MSGAAMAIRSTFGDVSATGERSSSDRFVTTTSLFVSNSASSATSPRSRRNATGGAPAETNTLAGAPLAIC